MDFGGGGGALPQDPASCGRTSRGCVGRQGSRQPSRGSSRLTFSSGGQAGLSREVQLRVHPVTGGEDAARPGGRDPCLRLRVSQRPGPGPGPRGEKAEPEELPGTPSSLPTQPRCSGRFWLQPGAHPPCAGQQGRGCSATWPSAAAGAAPGGVAPSWWGPRAAGGGPAVEGTDRRQSLGCGHLAAPAGAERVQAEAQGGPHSTACEINEVMSVETFGKVVERSLHPIPLLFLLRAVLPRP